MLKIILCHLNTQENRGLSEKFKQFVIFFCFINKFYSIFVPLFNSIFNRLDDFIDTLVNKPKSILSPGLYVKFLTVCIFAMQFLMYFKHKA